MTSLCLESFRSWLMQLPYSIPPKDSLTAVISIQTNHTLCHLNKSFNEFYLLISSINLSTFRDNNGKNNESLFTTCFFRVCFYPVDPPTLSAVLFLFTLVFHIRMSVGGAGCVIILWRPSHSVCRTLSLCSCFPY
jgi:hypothetical protein